MKTLFAVLALCIVAGVAQAQSVRYVQHPGNWPKDWPPCTLDAGGYVNCVPPTTDSNLPSTVTVSPSSVDMGILPLTNPITFVDTPAIGLTNTTGASLTLTSHVITGPEGSDDGKFIVNGCKAIAPGDTCYVMVQVGADADDPQICTPTPGAECVDTLTLNWSDGTQSSFVYGWGTPNTSVKGSVGPASLSFGTVPVGTQSADMYIVVTNTSPVSGVVTVGQIVAPAGFALDGDTCSNTSIPAGQSCDEAVVALPTATGLHQGTVTVPTNLGNNARSKVVVKVTGQ